MKTSSLCLLFSAALSLCCDAVQHKIQLHKKPVNVLGTGTRPYLAAQHKGLETTLNQGSSVPLSNFLDAQVCFGLCLICMGVPW
jgi:hypothetical protein